MTKVEQRLNVRLASEEHAALAAQARDCGLSMSDFVRLRCLEDDGRPRIIVDAENLKALYRDQRKLAGLLNQLMRHANSRHQDFPKLAGQVQQLLTELGKTTNEIGKFIAEARRSV